jgi:hypothetical protein
MMTAFESGCTTEEVGDELSIYLWMILIETLSTDAISIFERVGV